MLKIKWGLLIALLVYTRFVGLNWGLPYPFHPDERNIAVALLELVKSGNPHFFAYGQFPLYLGYLLHFGREITFESAVMALRFISAVTSVLTVYFAIVILNEVKNPGRSPKNALLDSSLTLGMTAMAALLFIFSPALIQFAHFGTTESLLMLAFTAMIYFCLKQKYILVGVAVGIAAATKVSSLIFAIIPIAYIFYYSKNRQKNLLKFFVPAGALSILLSLHNLISFNYFISTIRYESDIALGKIPVFYTRQFEGTLPIIFQIEKIFPYSLGIVALITFIVGFFTLPFDKKHNFLRLSFLVYFLPTVFLFTKWTRFMAPVMPLMLILATLVLYRIKNTILLIILTLFLIAPGVKYLSVYYNPDIRFVAWDWIEKNIPRNSYVLSEGGDVVDIAGTISFDFYNLEAEPRLQQELNDHLAKADYIIVPSRRVFMNHKRENYPILNRYYDDLFSGRLGFKKVAEFKVLDDESAEETWSVFDHPVIRIYKRI